MTRIKKRRARFLYGDVPTEHRCFAGAESAKHCRGSVIRIRVVHDRNEDLHLCADRQTNTCASDLHSFARVIDNARHFGRSESRLAIDRRDQRIADNRLADFTRDAAESGRHNAGRRSR